MIITTESDADNLSEFWQTANSHAVPKDVTNRFRVHDTCSNTQCVIPIL